MHYPKIARKLLKFNRNTRFRLYSTLNDLKAVDITKIRNIGILAHIDAGKTTTTERMLYYSGKIKQMGEVHHGNTVTDYMSQERERGITIKSAGVTFDWKSHRFNLIDTPGHIDFTMEVEETLSALDGVVIILDGSAGVEAQTLTVWRQADRYSIPRIVYINKMDRSDANLLLSCSSIEHKLEKPTLCLQMPLIDNGKLTGLVDVLTLKTIMSSKDRFLLNEQTEPKIWHQAKEMYSKLINNLADINDSFANTVISVDSIDKLQTADIVRAVRTATLQQVAVPVFCGSSYKNIGVQPLMDSIILYLPSPDERNQHFNCFGDSLCARAFKIIHDKQKGPLVFFRIHSGVFNKNQKFYNVTQDRTEQTGKLYIAYADEFQEIDQLGNGNIAVVSGLKNTVVGDLIAKSATIAQNTKKEMIKLVKSKKLCMNEEVIEKIFSTGAKVPEPVFFCSIEPPSPAYQNSLDHALIELQREDPSLRVTHDTETGQTILAGMGELHLEVIRDRILKEYKVQADLGPLQIAYREAPINKVSCDINTETKVGNSRHIVSVAFTLTPMKLTDDNILKLDKTPEAASNLANIFPKHLLAVKQGVEVALSHGPKIHSKVVDVQVMLHKLEVGKGTSDTVIAATVTQCIQKLLVEAQTSILEPIMSLEIVIPEEYVPGVLTDLSRRRSSISNIIARGNSRVITCETPLAELFGYSTSLRTVSSGTATFTMEFLEYKLMSSLDECKAIESVRGF